MFGQPREQFQQFSQRYYRRLFTAEAWINWQHNAEIQNFILEDRLRWQRAEVMHFLTYQDDLALLGKFHPTSI